MTITKLWASNPTPGTTDSGDGSAYSGLGTHFKSSVDCVVTGIRFYKHSSNTGTHYGFLWRASDRALMGIMTFTGETSSGWQEQAFPNSIAIVANTDYIIAVSCPNGHYSTDSGYFTSAAYTTDSPLTAYKSSDVSPGNGVYNTNATLRYPNSTFGSTCYWVGVVIDDASTTDTVGNATRLFANGETIATADSGDAGAYNMGMRFTVAADGTINGVYFYKHSSNTGTHVINLWDSGGTKLAEKTVSGESASGWQYQAFDTPVSVTAGSTYTASYTCPSGHYSRDNNFFSGTYNNSPLKGLNGYYAVGSTPAYPTNTSGDPNYWVDVAFTPAASGLSIPVVMYNRQMQGMS